MARAQSRMQNLLRRCLDTDGGLAENALSENGDDAAASTLATAGTDRLEVGGRGRDRRGGSAVEVCDAKDISGAALGRVVKTRARVVRSGAATTGAATRAATRATARAAARATTRATTRATAGATVAAASAGVGGIVGIGWLSWKCHDGAGGQEEGGDGEGGLHFESLIDVVWE